MQAEAAGTADRSSVLAALKHAAAATGSDFHYLLGTAMRESSLKPNAQSASSSATGLFQFIDQTWLGLVKEHGAQHGIGNLANAITRDANGRYRADAAQKQSILALRKDPQLCALMAGEHAKSTQGQLKASLGREICGGELYAAHFLGPDADSKLIRLAEKDPKASAAVQFPQAANANKSVFYHADGRAKSVREVYDWALRQPGGEGTVRVAALPDITPAAVEAPTLDKARAHVVTAQSDEIQMLLASVMNWQPRGGQGLFGALFGLEKNATPSSALSFNSSLLNLFSDSKKSTS
ncbi:MAG: hypothetical protein RL274_1392 [Pseudomonadota bacterium]|jgi:hypothetical protein